MEDIHNPLHTTKNYDGQLTGNKGIHSRYERWMVETYLDQLDSAIHPDPGSSPGRRLMPMIFNWLRGSYVWVDNLLLADRLSKTPGKKVHTQQQLRRCLLRAAVSTYARFYGGANEQGGYGGGFLLATGLEPGWPPETEFSACRNRSHEVTAWACSNRHRRCARKRCCPFPS
ncbi:MAG: hypothetical protein Q9P14_06620 [candidate division KSB1 bacterium]|nr:hypothetical protein [candidate division KSB1 bacterium]